MGKTDNYPTDDPHMKCLFDLKPWLTLNQVDVLESNLTEVPHMSNPFLVCGSLAAPAVDTLPHPTLSDQLLRAVGVRTAGGRPAEIANLCSRTHLPCGKGRLTERSVSRRLANRPVACVTAPCWLEPTCVRAPTDGLYTRPAGDNYDAFEHSRIHISASDPSLDKVDLPSEASFYTSEASLCALQICLSPAREHHLGSTCVDHLLTAPTSDQTIW